MNNFIMGFAIFLILIFFPIQWTINQVNHYKIQSTNNIVHMSVQKARIEGYFKEANINEMRTKIAEALSINPSEVRIDVTTVPKYRFKYFDQREMIKYEIGVPIKKIIASNIFLDIDDNENKMEYIIKGEVTSELLAP